MDIAMNVVLLVAAMVAAAAGIGAVLALRLTPRGKAARARTSSRRTRHSRLDGSDSRHGRAASGESTTPADGVEVKARIKALRASLHRDHERPAAPPPHQMPNFADTEVFEDGDELPTMILHQPVAAPPPAPAPVAGPLASAPKTPAFELLRLDFGAPAPANKAAANEHGRGLAR